MAIYEAKGTVKCIMETQTFPSGFSKREFVINTFEDKYPQDIKFVMFKEKADVLDTISENDIVNVAFGIKGNEYNDNFYVDLNAIRIEVLESANLDNPSEAPAHQDTGEPKLDDEEEPLPF